MMSLMAIAGFAFGGIFDGAGNSGVDDTSEPDYLYERESWAQDLAHHNLVDSAVLNDAGEVGPASVSPAISSDPAPDIFDYNRGDMIAGFDPSSDLIELEYTASLGVPDVTITDFADGSGASIALNGVVVADVTGAQGLDPNSVNLIAV
jgi:hypothetical protein